MTRTLLRALLALAVVAGAGLAFAPLLSRSKPGPASPAVERQAPAPEGNEAPAPAGGEASAPAEGPAPAQSKAPKGQVWNEARLQRWLEESPSAPWLLYGLKGLLALLGVVFLVREFLIDDRRRHGMTPAGWGPWRARTPVLDAFRDLPGPAPGSPGGGWPTAVAEPLAALGLGILFPFAVQVLLVAFWPPGQRPMGEIEFGIAVVTLALLPPALVTALRRLRLGRGLLPGPSTALGLGLSFACIATLIVLPVQILWGYLLIQRGTPLEVQHVVQAFADPANPAQPWLIAIFGVFVAPFTEEAVFRGLLYPALRQRAPGGPFGAAVLVALLFALIHGNLMAFVPLFVLALVLCWVMERTNSLLACVTVHAVHNATSLAPMIGRLLEGGSGGNAS